MKTINTIRNYYFICCLLHFLLIGQNSQGQNEETYYVHKQDGHTTKNLGKAACFMQILRQNDTTYICSYYDEYSPVIRQKIYSDSPLITSNGRFCWYDPKGKPDSTGWVCRQKKDSVLAATRLKAAIVDSSNEIELSFYIIK